jgi:hypothetical protein
MMSNLISKMFDRMKVKSRAEHRSNKTQEGLATLEPSEERKQGRDEHNELLLSSE